MTATSRRHNSEGWGTSANSDQEVEFPEDVEWEDEETISVNGSLPPSTVDPREANLRSTPKRRRKPFPATVGRRSSVVPHIRQSQAKPIDTPQESIVNRNNVVNHAKDGSLFVAEYAFDIIKSAILMLKHPLKLLAFMWLLALVMAMAWFQLRKTISPFCGIPGLRHSTLCQPITSTKAKWADYDRLAQVQSTSFGKILAETVGNSALSLEIKRAEMATADLATSVRVSDLKAKKTLEGHLLDFNQHAKKAGRGLQKLSSKIGGAVDRYAVEWYYMWLHC